jgi:hypothetical protein
LPDCHFELQSVDRCQIAISSSLQNPHHVEKPVCFLQGSREDGDDPCLLARDQITQSNRHRFETGDNYETARKVERNGVAGKFETASRLNMA